MSTNLNVASTDSELRSRSRVIKHTAGESRQCLPLAFVLENILSACSRPNKNDVMCHV